MLDPINNAIDWETYKATWNVAGADYKSQGMPEWFARECVNVIVGIGRIAADTVFLIPELVVLATHKSENEKVQEAYNSIINSESAKKENFTLQFEGKREVAITMVQGENSFLGKISDNDLKFIKNKGAFWLNDRKYIKTRDYVSKAAVEEGLVAYDTQKDKFYICLYLGKIQEYIPIVIVSTVSEVPAQGGLILNQITGKYLKLGSPILGNQADYSNYKDNFIMDLEKNKAVYIESNTCKEFVLEELFCPTIGEVVNLNGLVYEITSVSELKDWDSAKGTFKRGESGESKEGGYYYFVDDNKYVICDIKDVTPYEDDDDYEGTF